MGEILRDESPHRTPETDGAGQAGGDRVNIAGGVPRALGPQRAAGPAARTSRRGGDGVPGRVTSIPPWSTGRDCMTRRPLAGEDEAADGDAHAARRSSRAQHARAGGPVLPVRPSTSSPLRDVPPRAGPGRRGWRRLLRSPAIQDRERDRCLGRRTLHLMRHSTARWVRAHGVRIGERAHYVRGRSPVLRPSIRRRALGREQHQAVPVLTHPTRRRNR